MARVPDHQLTQARFSGLEIPQGAFRVSGESMVNLARTIGGAVDLVQGQVLQAQRIRNRRDILTERRAMDKLQADFQNEIVESGMDPSEWLPAWEKKLNGYRAGLDSRKYPPAVMDELNERYSDFAGASAISITGGALKENRRVASGLYRTEMEDRRLRNDYSGMRELNEEAHAENVIDDVEHRGNELAADRGERKFTIEQDIDHNPAQVLTDLESGDKYADLTPYEKDKVKQAAETERAKRAKANLEILFDQVENGIVRTQDEFEKNLDGIPELSDTERKVATNNFQVSVPISTEEQFGVADRIRDDFNAFKAGEINLEAYTKRYAEISAMLSAQGKRPGVDILKGQLNQRFQLVMGPQGNKLSEKEARDKAAGYKDTADGVKELVRKRASGMTDTSIAKELTQWQKDNPNGELSDVQKSEVRAKFEVDGVPFRKALEQAMMEWMQGELDAGRTPNETQAREYMDKIQNDVSKEVAREAKAEREKPLQRAPKQPKGKPLFITYPDGSKAKIVDEVDLVEPLNPGQQKYNEWLAPEGDEVLDGSVLPPPE